MKKLTTEFIRNELAKEGYQLIGEYVNANTKFDYICPVGHKHSIAWGHWSKGIRCAKCSFNYKLTTEDVREEFASKGYQLIGEYVNNATKLSVICPNGEQKEVLLNNWRKSQKRKEARKWTTEFVRGELAKEGYQMLGEYVHSATKFDFICPKGHHHSTNWDNWRQNYRCAICAQNIKLTTEYVRAELAKEGYQLMSEYVNNKTKFDFTCPEGHQSSINWNDWQQGHRCGVCSGINTITTEHVRAELAKEGYELLDEYKNPHSKFKFICPKGHTHSMRWSCWKNGRRCGQCRAKRFEELTASILDEYAIIYQRELRVDKYRVDFYLHDFDLFLEIDERHHKYQVEEDQERQAYIEKKTGKEFIRIDATKGEDFLREQLIKAITGLASLEDAS